MRLEEGWTVSQPQRNCQFIEIPCGMGQVYLSSFSPHFRRQLYQAGPSISNHLMMADDAGHFSQAAQRGG